MCFCLTTLQARVLYSPLPIKRSRVNFKDFIIQRKYMGLRNSPDGLLLCLIKSLCKCYCNCFFELGSGLIRSIWSAQNWVRIRSLSPLAGIKSLKRMGFTLHISVLILKPIWYLIRAESYFFLLKHYQSTRCKLHHHFNIRLIWVGYPVEGGRGD